MKDLCISCEKHKAESGGILCYTCKREENNRELDAIDARAVRTFAIQAHDLERAIPALRRR